MAIDLSIVLAYSAFIGFAAFGAFTRAMFGIYRAYNTMPVFVLEKRRIGFEILASIFFGIFSVLILREIGLFQFGLNIAALVAGFLGADLTNLIAKRIGLTKGMQVIVSKQQMEYADLNERQVKALQFAEGKGRITNKIYQKVNETTPTVAKKELAALVRKGKLFRTGYNKSTSYVPPHLAVTKLPKTRPGRNRVVSRPSFQKARKTHQKRPGRKLHIMKTKFENTELIYRQQERMERNN